LAKAGEDLLTHEKTHEAAKKGEADHPVMVARFARRAQSRNPRSQTSSRIKVTDQQLGSACKAGAPVRKRTVNVLNENFDADIRSRIGDARIAMLIPDAMRACIDAPREREAPGATARVYWILRGLLAFAIRRECIFRGNGCPHDL
jgi:hypothetical protein